MTISYRGVPADMIVHSLKEADLFLREAALGPATEAHLDGWRAGAPFEKIGRAGSPEDLSRIMRESGSEDVFRRYIDYFRVRALLDDTRHAARIAAGIAAWGGFEGVELADYRQVDEEMDSAIAVECARFLEPDVLRKSNFEHVPSQDFLRAFFEDGEGAARQVFAGLDLRDRHLLKETLLSLPEISSRPEAPLDGPFSCYGIEFDGAPTSFETLGKAFEPLREAFARALQPFYARGEVQMTGIGLINREEPYKTGATFVATRAAAQAVADALPRERVIDWQEKRIFPAP